MDSDRSVRISCRLVTRWSETFFDFRGDFCLDSTDGAVEMGDGNPFCYYRGGPNFYFSRFVDWNCGMEMGHC